MEWTMLIVVIVWLMASRGRCERPCGGCMVNMAKKTPKPNPYVIGRGTPEQLPLINGRNGSAPSRKPAPSPAPPPKREGRGR